MTVHEYFDRWHPAVIGLCAVGIILWGVEQHHRATDMKHFPQTKSVQSTKAFQSNTTPFGERNRTQVHNGLDSILNGLQQAGEMLP